MKKINSIKSDFEFQVNEGKICVQQKPTAYVKKFKPVLLLYSFCFVHTETNNVLFELLMFITT